MRGKKRAREFRGMCVRADFAMVFELGCVREDNKTNVCCKYEMFADWARVFRPVKTGWGGGGGESERAAERCGFFTSVLGYQIRPN